MWVVFFLLVARGQGSGRPTPPTSRPIWGRARAWACTACFKPCIAPTQATPVGTWLSFAGPPRRRLRGGGGGGRSPFLVSISPDTPTSCRVSSPMSAAARGSNRSDGRPPRGTAAAPGVGASRRPPARLASAAVRAVWGGIVFGFVCVCVGGEGACVRARVRVRVRVRVCCRTLCRQGEGEGADTRGTHRELAEHTDCEQGKKNLSLMAHLMLFDSTHVSIQYAPGSCGTPPGPPPVACACRAARVAAPGALCGGVAAAAWCCWCGWGTGTPTPPAPG